MFNFNRVIVRRAALAALPALLICGSAFAAGVVDAPAAVTVHYDDLNLNSTQDIAGLYKRIESAATAVCLPAEGPHLASGIQSTAWHQCFYHALANAVHSVHNAKLSAYHWQRIRAWGQEADAPASVASR